MRPAASPQAAALRAGRLAGVGLDVFDPEPPPHHPLFDHTDVVLTPHLMGLTRRATAATFALRPGPATGFVAAAAVGSLIWAGYLVGIGSGVAAIL